MAAPKRIEDYEPAFGYSEDGPAKHPFSVFDARVPVREQLELALARDLRSRLLLSEQRDAVARGMLAVNVLVWLLGLVWICDDCGDITSRQRLCRYCR